MSYDEEVEVIGIILATILVGVFLGGKVEFFDGQQFVVLANKLKGVINEPALMVFLAAFISNIDWLIVFFGNFVLNAIALVVLYLVFLLH
jgi:hypothetical protein